MECKIDNVRDMAYQLHEREPHLTILEAFNIAVSIQHHNMLNAISDEMHTANQFKDEMNGILAGNLSTIADSISEAGSDEHGAERVAHALRSISDSLNNNPNTKK